MRLMWAKKRFGYALMQYVRIQVEGKAAVRAADKKGEVGVRDGILNQVQNNID